MRPASCPECREQVDHCHGTLLISTGLATGETCCTGPDCTDHDVARHALWMSVAETAALTHSGV